MHCTMSAQIINYETYKNQLSDFTELVTKSADFLKKIKCYIQ